jgi:hypothetical protein
LSNAESSASELQGLSVISFKKALWNAPNLNQNSDITLERDKVISNPTSSSEAFPLWLGAVIGIVCSLIIVLLLYLIYNRSFSRMS